MDAKNQHQPHKRGANRKEFARKEPKRDRNYAQSRDVWEDRCTRQHKIMSTIPNPAGGVTSILRKATVRTVMSTRKDSWMKSLPQPQSEFSIAVTAPKTKTAENN
jgi:hypothetical protein